MTSLHRHVILLAAVPMPAFAAPPLPGAGKALQVFAGLAIVLALIAAATWAARRLQGFRPQGRGHIRIVEGLAVGTREKLLLIEVDDQRVLLGMCPGRIQTLARFSRDAAPASFDAALDAAAAEHA
ncbi:MAG: flagellar biosynthetic protein FliO [Gammaproteobacteria bacterium]